MNVAGDMTHTSAGASNNGQLGALNDLLGDAGAGTHNKGIILLW